MILWSGLDIVIILTISNYCMLRGANKAPMNYTG